MSNSGFGFGGFLVGLGIGWYLFKFIDFSLDLVSYFLIFLGIVIILGGLLRSGSREHPISSMLGGVIGGLILATFLTQGFGFIFSLTDNFSDFGGYRASDTFTLNTPVTEDSIALNITSINGGIEVTSWNSDFIEFEIEVKAKGSTQSEAEDNIDRFEHELSSNIIAGVQEISLSFPITNRNWNLYSVSIDAYIPSSSTVSYMLETTNGLVTLNEIVGDIIIVKTTNGAIKLNTIKAELIDAQSTNGIIEGIIDTKQSDLRTTNGAIEITLSKSSGSHIFTTTNGIIDLNLPSGSEVGYKFDLDTSIGLIDVNLSNIDYIVNEVRSKKGETSGYSTKTVQIEITAKTSIGGIELH
jgi:DUF4097 and DUF4098 domain-containing protein YvlB